MPYRSIIVACMLCGLVSCSSDAPPTPAEVPEKGNVALDEKRPASSATGASSETPATGEPQTSSAPAVSAPAELLTPREIAAGWVSLFDGQSLFGWRPNDDPQAGGANWRVADGVLTADTSAEPALLLTPVRFSDFELRVEYRLAAGGNSGLFLRTVPDPRDPAVDCYELNLCDTHPEFPTGSLVGRQKAEGDVPQEGEWRTLRVRAEGNQIVALLDGKIVMDFVDDSEHARRTGWIGLQHNEGKIEFRRVSLRPLGTMPLFDGESLAGWREVPGSQSKFDPAEGTIHLTGGPGFLESEATWADFVLQFDVKTNAREVNSGLFFRAQPGTAEAPSNGYELQICNSFADGNRARPNDYGRGFGTGAIMHRASARYIVADDGEWATLTLVADGPRLATWVNGFPTAVWVDERAPHENPREGQRLTAGHLSLQGHDDETDVSFRHLRILDMKQREAPASIDE